LSLPDLIGLLEGDLTGYRLERRHGDAARFVSESGSGPVLEVTEKVERRFLGRTRVARFGATFPCQGWPTETLQVRHTGGFRRRGVSIQSDVPDSALAALLESDDAFVAATTALDFKLYEIAVREGTCTATVELMGASLVAIALPPIRSYVRLYPDQRVALVDGLAALERQISVSPADRRY
jgi:hypothetical protein